MAVSRITPNVEVSGLFVVKPPFIVGASVSYRVSAVRRFTKIIGDGTDLYQTLYVPNGISEENFKADLEADACIVTLQPEYGTPIEVPDTYILSYPNSDVYKYRRLIIAVDMDALPPELDVSYMSSLFAATASDVLGVDAKVQLVEIPLDDTVSPEQHRINEATRIAKIKTRETIYADNERLTAQNVSLLETQAKLIELLEANGIDPTP